MNRLPLHDFHTARQATFGSLNGQEIVAHYGDVLEEHRALRYTAGVIDLTCRSRLSLTGADHRRFLHGQLTNDVHSLQTGQGCYAALVTAKGKLVSDANVYRLENEVLLDLEPGLGGAVTQRLNQYIIADDVQVVDASPHYGLLSLQGPRARRVIGSLGLEQPAPERPYSVAVAKHPRFGELYLMNHARTGMEGFDLFAPIPSLISLMELLVEAARTAEGRLCGWEALEVARMEAGLPRFGADMDESNLAPEAGLDARAISYTKGCYIGQEVIARIRTYGQVTKTLRGLKLPGQVDRLPSRGEKLFHQDKEAGYVTSATFAPSFDTNIALGYVRREVNQLGAILEWRDRSGAHLAEIVALPFRMEGAPSVSQ